MTDEEIVQHFNNFLLEAYNNEFQETDFFCDQIGLCGNFSDYLDAMRVDVYRDFDTYEWVPIFVYSHGGDTSKWEGYHLPYVENYYEAQGKRVQWVVGYLEKEGLI